jgi:hypothetical protein
MVLYATFTLIKNTTVLLIFANTDNHGAKFTIRTDVELTLSLNAENLEFFAITG